MLVLTQETLKASFHALVDGFWTDLKKGHVYTAAETVDHLEDLAAVIADEWYAGRIPSYRESLEAEKEARV